jgi:lactam utilization protein B
MNAANSDGSFAAPIGNSNNSFSDNTTGSSSSSTSGSSAYVSMKTLSDVKKFGGKAMALAKNATQANVTRQLGALNSKTTDKQLKACNFYARVAYINNTTATDTATTSTNASNSSVDRAHVRLIGKTNTEYCTASPVWGTNTNKSACPHNQVMCNRK